jgi:hypothetical protein
MSKWLLALIVRIFVGAAYSLNGKQQAGRL